MNGQSTHTTKRFSTTRGEKAVPNTRAINVKNWPKNSYIVTSCFFFFLLARNWPVFLLADLRDGFLVKTTMVSYGFDIAGVKHYIHEFVLRSWNGHFIPIWFVIFFCTAYLFDSNPWALGFLSFSFAAILLGLIFKICNYFFHDKANGYLYAFMVSLAFSSTGFFLEALTWKWMLTLIMSSVFFLAALTMLLEKKNFVQRHLLLYSSMLFASMWTFGTAWIQVWCLALFLLLRGRKWKDKVVILTAVIATIGTILAIATNREPIPNLNPIFLISNIPSVLILAATNVLLLTAGIFRFTGLEHMYISSVVGVTVAAAFLAHYTIRFKRRRFSERDALVTSLIVAYSVIIALSMFRIMPSEGIIPTSDSQNYIIGGRYLFVYSVPIILAFAIALGEQIMRLPKYILYIFVAGILIYGIVIQATYSNVDPDISNKNRTAFYNLTPKALKIAETNHILLPDSKSDLFWQGYQVKISAAIRIRKDSYNYKPIFKNPNDLNYTQCLRIKHEGTLKHWLNLYSHNWCK